MVASAVARRAVAKSKSRCAQYFYEPRKDRKNFGEIFAELAGK